MSVAWLLGWNNLVFLVPLGLALAYLFAYALSGWTFGDADVDVGADADVEVDVDVDADWDLNADADADHAVARPDIGADSDVGQAHGLLASLTWLGVGRVPLSIVLMVLCLTFGLVGFATNQLLRDSLGVNGFFVALPIAFVLAFAITSGVSQLIARYMPLNESSARPVAALVGSRATVVFAVSADSGTVTVSDAGGDRYQVAARSLKPIAAGSEVVLVDYRDGSFLVKQLDF